MRIDSRSDDVALTSVPSHTCVPLLFLSHQGNEASEGKCSKCFREMQAQKDGPVTGAPVACKTIPVASTDSQKAPQPEASQSEAPQPMEVDTVAPEPVKEAPVKSPPATTSVTPKKKKKKASYKSMMAGMMQSTPGRNLEMEKESLRNVTGGGAFTKIDKI